MPKFLVGRDIEFLRNIARELVETVVQNNVYLYKINLSETKINIYGEALNKTWHTGVELYALINKEADTTTYEGFGPDTNQNIEFRFDREHCRDANAYPEVGDVIYFDNSYYEIDDTDEFQFVGGLPGTDSEKRNWSIICSTFMVNKSNLNIEKRIN